MQRLRLLVRTVKQSAYFILCAWWVCKHPHHNFQFFTLGVRRCMWDCTGFGPDFGDESGSVMLGNSQAVCDFMRTAHLRKNASDKNQGNYDEAEYNNVQLSRLSDYPAARTAIVHDHELQLHSLTQQLSAMTKRVEDLEARCPASRRRAEVLCDGLTGAELTPLSDADATHVIKMGVSLPYTVNEFDAIKQV